jgi:hypothetical protein
VLQPALPCRTPESRQRACDILNQVYKQVAEIQVWRLLPQSTSHAPGADPIFVPLLHVEARQAWRSCLLPESVVFFYHLQEEWEQQAHTGRNGGGQDGEGIG